ncbi:mannose-6-phosphate isomerase, class I [Pseudalkalibacillus caeni]|uniref:Mannose-6-phosphate isomerase n=1 Tax=Exobacillus caeni TaxID=2574798 RepID=A0A5R9F4A0_9BACL|nr:mannose-6-phosphate isomerase, class I [Pseudalkalibacillus caeni]TLS38407.1 mannose-6-phosphate isomerase, class I [Pseudalkalibacillus caeni]
MYEKEPIFLEPVFKERIWGGTKLREEFGYDIPSDTTGECWGISAHPNGPSKIKNGPLEGKTLEFAWGNHRELFANEPGDEFPLLIKILDAKKDLSVQVHPDDKYAREVEGEPYGKTECWYIIDCEEGAELIFGHHAQTRDEFEKMVEEGEWDKLLRRIPISPGEFYYVPSGTIHAIGAGTMILETQQSSDITYRVYDYNRRDAEGNTRELHIEASIEVSIIPHVDPHFDPTREEKQGLTSEKLITQEYFTVYKWELDGKVSMESEEKYLLASVLEGEAELITGDQSYNIKKGDLFILPSTISGFSLEGKAHLVVSHT